MGFIFDLPIEVLIFTMIASMVSALMVDNVYQRGRIFLAGIMVSMIYGIMILSDVSMASLGVATILRQLSFGVSSGILCSIITIGSLPLWEIIFKILTPIKLLEYANPNHPLMKKMLLEAPGTYHHSILVANLSEAAAHDINCNTFLTRVGAYFHDIGKIEKPYFYIENQYDGHNPHDEFVPMVSAKIIKDHVIKGIQMGKKYRLPKEIIEFIEQHHGTTQIQYFYQKALEFEEEDVIDHSLYTYEGPMPSTKEIAIVMLADSVEAAVRSLKKPNQRMISDLIEKIIQKKIGEGQLNNSGLTLSEIQAIQSSFVANLTSAFHERIEYPTERKDTHINRVK
jgi:putative nucleotidyltransferase with HDIG domain